MHVFLVSCNRHCCRSCLGLDPPSSLGRVPPCGLGFFMGNRSLDRLVDRLIEWFWIDRCSLPWANVVVD